MKPLKIALLQYRDAGDVRSWSGILHFSKAALERHLGEVVDLSPAPVPLLPFRILRKVIHLLTGRMYSYDHDPFLARFYSWYFERRVRRESPDLVFAPAASPCIAYSKITVPILYYTDGTWRQQLGYYPNYSNMLSWSARSAEDMESRALQRADICLFSSEWAAESARTDYGVDPARVHTVYIGANIPSPPDRSAVLPRVLSSKLRLLFIGTLWDRKGGAIAHETLVRLLDAGHDAELTVVGCAPPSEFAHPRMKVIPFLNKQVPAERARFEQLWAEADLFLLPTRAETAGIVFCEASAYGVPTFATDTGGVSSIVVDGKNGFTLPIEAGGAEWAEKIADLLRDPARYAQLCESSRALYEARLNWDFWGKRVASIAGEMLPELSERIEAWQRDRSAEIEKDRDHAIRIGSEGSSNEV